MTTPGLSLDSGALIAIESDRSPAVAIDGRQAGCIAFALFPRTFVADVCQIAIEGEIASKVVLAVENNPADANYRLLQENLDRLRGMKDAAGRKLEVIPLPMPSPIVFAGQRLPASYANFYIANDIVIVPTFNDPGDRVALDTIAREFPSREVVGIHAVDLVWGFGTLHCLTQQQPAPR